MKIVHYSTFDFDLGDKVNQNVAQYPLHRGVYSPASFGELRPTIKEEMHLRENTLFDL